MGHQRNSLITVLSYFCMATYTVGDAGLTDGTVVMHVLYGSTTNYPKMISFNETMFQEFLRCLCNTTTHTCMAHFGNDNMNHPVTRVSTKNSISGNETGSSFYNCILPSENDTELHCMKLRSCSSSSNVTPHRINGCDNCDFKCVGFAWTDGKKEKLITRHKELINSDSCEGDQCIPARSSTTISCGSIRAKGQSSNDNTGVIVGVVLGIVLVVIVIGLVIFLRRRGNKCLSRKADKPSNGTNVSRTANMTHAASVPQIKCSSSPSYDILDIDYGYSVANGLEENNLKKNTPGVQSDLHNMDGKNNAGTSNDFGYSQAKDPNSAIVGVHGVIRSGDKEKNEAHSTSTIGANLENIFQQTKEKVGEKTKVLLHKVNGANLGGEYDYAMPEDDGESTAEQSRPKESVSTGTEIRRGTSIERGYEYCKPDGDNCSEGPETKSASVETGYATAEDDRALSEGGYADNALSADASPKSQHVYTKLGEKVRHITHPYNVLLHPKEDPKIRQSLPPPASNTEAANQKSTYSFAQPISDNTTNPIAVINVNPPSSQKGAISSDQKDDQGLSRSDFTLSTDKDIAPDNKHTYFELEKQEDNEDSASSCSEGSA